MNASVIAGTGPLSAVDPESPWLGLRSFSEETSDYFFGRQDELQEIFERVVHKPLTVLFGRSGLGKTSLLGAGLVPRLRSVGYFPVPIRLRYDSDSPALEKQVLLALADALSAAGNESLGAGARSCQSLWLLLHDPENGFAGISGSDGTVFRPVFLIDQFEEIFTLGERRPGEQSAFRDLLASIAENRPPPAIRDLIEGDDALADRLDYQTRPAKALLSLREDFLHLLERWRRDVPSVMENRFELRLLTGPQALQAVVEPGRLRSSDEPIVSSETGAAIVRFVAGVREDVSLSEIDAVPPLLSLVCAELNEQRLAIGDSFIRLEQLAGRSEDILNRFYAESFSSCPEGVQVFVEERLLDEAGYRQSITFDTAQRELARLGLDQSTAEHAIGALVDRRLLVIEERGGVRRIELTHDVLTGVARRSREARRQQEERRSAERREAEARTAQVEAEARLRVMRKKNRRLAFAVVAALLTGVAALFYAWRAQIANAEASAATFEESKAREQAKQREAEAQQRLADNLEETGSRLLNEQNDYDRALVHLNEAFKIDSRLRAADLGMPRRRTLDLLLARALAPLDAAVGTFSGHTGIVITAAMSPDGKRLLTGSADSKAMLWETGSQRLIRSLEAHVAPVCVVAFSPDGKKLLTGSRDGAIWLWDEEGNQQHEAKGHHGSVNFAAFISGGERIVTASADGTVGLWDVGTGKRLAELTPKHGPIWAAALNADATRFAAGAADGTGMIYDLVGNGEPVTLERDKGHTEQISSVVFSADGRSLLTGSVDGTAKLWNATTGEFLCAFATADEPSPVTAVAFSRQGDRLLIGRAAGSVTIFTADGKTTVAQISASRLNGCVFTPDGVGVITTHDDGSVNIWDTTTGAQLTHLAKHTGAVLGVSLPLDPHIEKFVTFSRDFTARLWDLAKARLPRPLVGHNAPLLTAAVSPDGSRIVTGGEDNAARLWNAATGEPIGEPMSHNDEWVLDAGFSADGSKLLTMSGHAVKIWNAADASEILLPGGTSITPETQFEGKPVVPDMLPFHNAVFTADGKSVIAASRGSAWTKWSLETGQALLRAAMGLKLSGLSFQPGGNLLLAVGDSRAELSKSWNGDRYTLTDQKAALAEFSHDGERIAVGLFDGSVAIYDVTGRLLHRLRTRGNTRVFSLSFSADDRLLIAGNADGAATVWNSITGGIAAPLIGHKAAVTAAAFHPDDELVATGDQSGVVKLWHAPTGREVATLRGHSRAIRTVAFVNHGSLLLTVGADARPKLWDLSPHEMASDTEVVAQINREVPYHFEENRVVPRSLTEANLFYNVKGLSLVREHTRKSTGVKDTDSLGFLAEQARDSFVSGHFDVAVRTASRAFTAGADTPALNYILSAAAATYDGVAAEAENHHLPILKAAISPDKRLFASAGADGFVTLGELPSLNSIRLLKGHSDRVFACAFSPDSRKLVTGGRDGTVRVWDAEAGLELFQLDHKTARAKDIAAGKITSERLKGEFQINEAMFTPDGASIITACDDGTVRVWDAATGAHRKTLGPHSGGVFTIAHDTAAALIAAGCRDGTVKLWRADTGDEIGLLAGIKSFVNRVTFSPDGTLLAAGSTKEGIKLWHTRDGSPAGEFSMKAGGELAYPEFSRDGRQVLVTTVGKAILLDVERPPRIAHEFPADSANTFVAAAHFSPDQKRIATSGDDRSVQLWNRETGVLLASYPGQPLGRTEAQWLSDENLLINSGTTLRLVDAKSPPHPEHLVRLAKNVPSAATFYQSATGPLVALAVENGVARVLNEQSGETLSQHAPEPVYQWGRDTRPVRSIRLSVAPAELCQKLQEQAKRETEQQQKTERVTTGNSDSSIIKISRQWAAADLSDSVQPTLRGTVAAALQKLRGLDIDFREETTDSVQADAVLVITYQTCKDVVLATIKLQSAGGDPLWRYKATDKPEELGSVADKVAEAVASANRPVAALSQDYERLATGTASGNIDVLETANGTKVLDFKPVNVAVTMLGFSKDHQRLLAGSESGNRLNVETVGIYDISTGDLLRDLPHAQRVTAVTFSPDGNLIATADDAGTVRVFGVPIPADHELRGHRGPLTELAFSSDGTRLISTGSDGTSTIWDTRSGNVYTTLAAQADLIDKPTSASFNPAGTLAVTGYESGAVTIWDVNTAKPLQVFRNHSAPVRFAHFSADSGTLLTVDSSGVAWTHALPGDRPSAEAVSRISKFVQK